MVNHVALLPVSILLFKRKNSKESKYTLLDTHSRGFLHLALQLRSRQLVFGASTSVRMLRLLWQLHGTVCTLREI